MKNILLYTDTPISGGAELQMFLLAKFLDKKEFTPIVAISQYPALDRLADNFQKEGIKVLRLPVKSKHDIRHYLELKRIFREEKIDILHAHVWNPASCRYAYLAAYSSKIPLIITEHDPFKLNFVKDLFKKYSLKKVAKIVTVSDDNARVIKKLYPKFSKKITVIKNGIDLIWWESQLLRFTESDRKELKEKVFKAKENTLIITSVAELHERKGPKYLVEAISKLTQEFPNIKLVLIGEGLERKNLEKQIKKLQLEDHVTLLGRQKEIPKLLKASDIFVLPSIREAFGFVLTEASMIPLPIIASKVGGIPEIIEDKKTGILVPPAAPDALAKALKTLIENPKQRAKLASATFSRVTKNFDAMRMAREYEEIYEEFK